MAIHVDPSYFQIPEWHDFPSKVPKLADKDFFQRDDGILRLNGDAEEYLAGWYNLNYENTNINILNLQTLSKTEKIQKNPTK